MGAGGRTGRPAVTLVDLGVLLAQYQAGLEAEMVLLRRLESLSERERELTGAGDYEGLKDITDQRDSVVANLVAVESEMRPIRQTLAMHRTHIGRLKGFQDVADLHKAAGRLISSIVESDKHSLAALQEAEQSRRFATQELEKGESTLAAYRKVVAPPLASATLVNRRG